jgi:peptide/nickel transport system substrate-binding protein
MSKTTLAMEALMLSSEPAVPIYKRLAFALAVACAAVSCSRAAPKAAPARDTLTRHLMSDPPTLDPTTTNEDFGLRVEDLIFKPLIGIDRDRRFVPALALSWAASSDGLAYDIRLDPTAKWEDGSPVTSNDVAYTIERVRDPKVPAGNWRSGFEDLAAVETPDASTVIVRFKHPDAQRLFAFTLPIVSAAAYARPAEVDRKPVGTGPYRLESWSVNQALTLRRRKDVPAASYPFARVVFRTIPAAAVWFQAGTRGDLDEFIITRDQVSVAQKSPDFLAKNRLVKVPQFLTVTVVFNCRNPILADARVRRALTMAWPRAETARRLYPPEGATLLSGPYPPGVPENANDVHPPPYDPQASARLLDAAGLKMGPDGFRRRGGKRVSFELLYATVSSIYRNIAEILRDSYSKVGVELVLRPLDWAAYLQRFDAGEYDLAPYANTPLPPKVNPTASYHSSQTPPNGQNTGYYKNPEADRLMEAAQREMDEPRRTELYRQVHRLLAADPPADFLWDADQYWGISKEVQGVEASSIGLFHFLPGPLAWRPAPAQ